MPPDRSHSNGLVRAPTHIRSIHPINVTPLKLQFVDAYTGEPIPSRSPSPEPERAAPRVYSSNHGASRGAVRTLFDSMLAKSTGVRDAKMRWTITSFCDEVFLRYQRALHGWPEATIFRNLSLASTGQLQELHELCTSDPPKLFFAEATAEQLHAARFDVAAAAPGPLFQLPALRLENRNIGKRTVSTWHVRNGAKSSKQVTEEEMAANDPQPVDASAGGLPIINKDGARLVWYKDGYREIGVGELSDDPISDSDGEWP